MLIERVYKSNKIYLHEKLFLIYSTVFVFPCQKEDKNINLNDSLISQ